MGSCNINSGNPLPERIRYHLLDAFRGFSVISMVIYHAIWDLVYIVGISIPWYGKLPGKIWQQSICWCFIFISGFCGMFGRSLLRSGIIVSFAGLLVTVVTVLVMPENRIVFGILTLIGACMLIAWIIKKTPLMKFPALPCIFSSFLFLLTKEINHGYLGFAGLRLLNLPSEIYQGIIPTFLGFTDPVFYSTDYFSLFPWLFLFLSGFFLSAFLKNKCMYPEFLKIKIPPLSFIGRHSLIIYLLHQPVLYLLCELIF